MNNNDYIIENGLDKLINFEENQDYERSVSDAVDGELSIPMPPQVDDLIRIHKIIRKRKCFTALEFGLGYSSLVIADALYKNQQDWDKENKSQEIRNRHMFKLFSVDTSPKWIDALSKRVPTHLSEHISISCSEVEVGTFQGQLCHYYCNIPNVIPDFIYLDGPHPKEVKGKIRGMSFQCDERTVMGADLLLMEPTFLPGLLILIDGRTNNARFLKNNFKRNYHMHWDKEGDITTFELNEERLGKYNVVGSDFYK